MRVARHGGRARSRASGRSRSCRSAGRGSRSTARSSSTTGSRPAAATRSWASAAREVDGHDRRSIAGEPHDARGRVRPAARSRWPRDRVHAAGAARPHGTRGRARARRADAVVCVVGTDDDWETEGNDRESMALPPPQDELVRAVAAVEPAHRRRRERGVAGRRCRGPTTSRAILQAWFPGEEWGNALADVLSGDVVAVGQAADDDSRCASRTRPRSRAIPGERGQVRYGEGVFVGYRWYDARRIEPRFCFGHGLSYTTFELGARRRGTASARRTSRVDEHRRGARRGSRAVLRARRRGVGGAARSRS